MIAEQFRPWMQKAVADVFESMCFLVPEGEPLSLPNAETGWVARKLSFGGAQNGSFGMATSLVTARLAASNFLGEEPDQIEDGEAGEILGELANMTCGILLGRIGSMQPFSVSPPRTDETWPHTAFPTHRITQAFAVEEGVLVAWLEMEPSR